MGTGPSLAKSQMLISTGLARKIDLPQIRCPSNNLRRVSLGEAVSMPTQSLAASFNLGQFVKLV